LKYQGAPAEIEVKEEYLRINTNRHHLKKGRVATNGPIRIEGKGLKTRT